MPRASAPGAATRVRRVAMGEPEAATVTTRAAPIDRDAPSGAATTTGTSSESPWVVFSQCDGAQMSCQLALTAAIDIITQ